MTCDRSAEFLSAAASLAAGPIHRWRVDRVIQAALTLHLEAVASPPGADVAEGGVTHAYDPAKCPTGMALAMEAKRCIRCGKPQSAKCWGDEIAGGCETHRSSWIGSSHDWLTLQNRKPPQADRRGECTTWQRPINPEDGPDGDGA